MRKIWSVIVGSLLILALFSQSESLAAALFPEDKKFNADFSFNRLNRMYFNDSTVVPAIEEYYGSTETPEHEALEVHASSDPAFDYMADSPYYTVYFKDTTMKLETGERWITLSVPQQELGAPFTARVHHAGNTCSIEEVFNSVDLSYEVNTSHVKEVMTIKRKKDFNEIIYALAWEGMTPDYSEDGSLTFYNQGKEVLVLSAPFMRDSTGSVSKGIFYDVVETDSGYELHKVLNDEGKKWLEIAVFPVYIDPTIEVIEDAYLLSGIKIYTPFVASGNVTSAGNGANCCTSPREYINLANGHQLTLTSTDLTIPGLGLDVTLNRFYETPAVFYGSQPYEYESPPVNIGKGWQLNFPYIGTKYLHLWGGAHYKIQWNGSTYENHKGSHFTLVKQTDNTYTLTMAGGTIYEFNTVGYLTEIKDVDGNSITFSYTEGKITSITDTIGRTVSFTYTGNNLWKISYNSCEIEYSYDGNGCLVWMEDFLNRRTSYYYNTGYNNWLLSKIVYPTSGYTTYVYDRFSDSGYYKYYVKEERVYETDQVRHYSYSYTGSFNEIASSTITIKNESDITQGSTYSVISDGLITEKIIKNSAGSPIKKFTYAYNSNNELVSESVYNDGVNVSYTIYYAYDNWGNCIYRKNAQGHEQFFSYANTSTSGFFVDNTGTVIRKFTNAFSNAPVPSTVHTALLGMAQRQDITYMRETYITYDSEGHPTHGKNLFGNETTYETYSGTFNEQTGAISSPVDLSGHTVAGNAILEISGLASDFAYQETHQYTPPYGTGCRNANWSYCSWSYNKYKTKYTYLCGVYPECDTYEGWAYIGPFTHYPGSVGYQSYSTNPSCEEQSYSFSVTTNWKAYPVQVQYKIDSDTWTTVTDSLSNGTARITVPISEGSHTLYFSESSSKDTKFSWTLWVPVDNAPNMYIASIQYDDYGNVTSITDSQSNTTYMTYSATYSYAYLTEVSKIVGTDTITTKATYDSDRGWVTSLQQPKGVDAGSGYDVIYTYDVLGRVIKKEFPLLPGQEQRAYIEFVYDCDGKAVTLIDPLGHYLVKEYDNLGRVITINTYTGTFGSGTLYTTQSYTYRYDDLVSTLTDAGGDIYSYTYDFLGRPTQATLPDSSSVSYTYDDTGNRITFTNGRGYERICWYDYLSRLEKVEEEYAAGTFTATIYTYDEIGHLLSFTDPENHKTSYTYASMYGLTETTYPDSQYETFIYDNVGNLISFTDCKNNTISYTYDTLYRLIEIEYEDQSTVSYTYDLNSNKIRMYDDAPNTGDYVAYTYDGWNRILTETRYIQDSYTISYQYDVSSRLTQMTYPDSMQVLYVYDDLNRITEVRRYIDGQNDEILFSNPHYDVESLLTQFDYGNDIRTFYTFDSQDRPLTIDVKKGAISLLDLDYTYDDNGNITQIQDHYRDTSGVLTPLQTKNYVYDGLDRLIEEKIMGIPAHTYSYDKAGNRTGKDSITYIVNSVNEVTALSDGTSFIYDANGNRIQKTKGDDTWKYTYDYANRLTKVKENQSVIGEYVYDGGGKRLQKTENGITTTYIYSGINPLYEENSTGIADYVYGPTGLLTKRTTINQESNTYYYHKDHLGSTRSVTDSGKNIITASTYHPFGEPDIEGSEHYLYTGKERDSTGLYYYGARYYDPETGRFVTRDLIKGRKSHSQTLNLYTYCLNNSINLIDPAGLDSMCIGDGESRRCFEYTDKGWIVYDGKGNKITSSTDIEKNLQESKYLKAILLVLMALGINVDGAMILTDVTKKDFISFNYEGITIEIRAMESDSIIGGLTNQPRPGAVVKITIYVSKDMSASELFHRVGHEMIHAKNRISGKYWENIKHFGASTANLLDEIEAYQWNLSQLCYMSFPGAFENYFYQWWYHTYILTNGEEPTEDIW